ncbi:hypothetical protein LINGRAHAP2_LOCUS14522 [Linum grandiflorum]
MMRGRIGKVVEVGEEQRMKDRDRDREDELQLFKELHKREKDRAGSLLQPISSDDLEANHSFYRIPSVKKSYDFFASGNAAKSDYDWLKTPPATPLFPSLEMEATGPPPLLLQREITIVQPLSRVGTYYVPSNRVLCCGWSTIMYDLLINLYALCQFSACTSANTCTTTTSSRPNIPTGASSSSFRQTGQPPSRITVNSSSSSPTTSNISITPTKTAAEQVKNNVKVTEATPGNRATRQEKRATTHPYPTPPSTILTSNNNNGIGKSNKLLQQSRRSSSNPAPPMTMRVVDRASSASRVRHPPAATTSTGSKPRGHSVTRSSVITTNTSNISRRSSTKTPSLYATLNNQQLHKEKLQTQTPTISSNNCKITGNKQIFGSKMVDKVMSARKAADESKLAAPVTRNNPPPTSPGLGFGRLSAPRNMELKRDRIVSSRHRS